MKLLVDTHSEVVHFVHSEVLLLCRKVKLSLPHFAVRRNFTHAVNFTAERQLHLPLGANLVVESACETHDTFDVGQEYKRYIFMPKTGVEKPKGIFYSGGK